MIEEHISCAHKQFRRLKKDDSRRDTWIAQLITAQSEAWNRTKKALWKQLRSVERIRNTAQKVRRILNPSGAKQPLSMVVAPDEGTGERQEFTKKTELEQACLAEAGRRFTQARHTPLLTSPLLDIFGEQGQTKAFEQVLNGTFQIPPTCDPHMAKFLAAVSRPNSITKVTARSIQAYQRGWQ